VPRAKLILVKEPCPRTDCHLEGQLHPRCRAHNHSRQPCAKWPLNGQLICKNHGGKTPKALLTAKRRLAYQEALAHVSRIVGLRISEALAADVTDLGSERGHRTLAITRKGGKKATVPLAPRTAAASDGYVGDRTGGPLFQTRTGGRWNRSEAWRTLRRLARTAVPKKANTLHPHDFRHAFVTLSQV